MEWVELIWSKTDFLELNQEVFMKHQGGTVLMFAHRVIESITLDKKNYAFKRQNYA